MYLCYGSAFACRNECTAKPCDDGMWVGSGKRTDIKSVEELVRLSNEHGHHRARGHIVKNLEWTREHRTWWYSMYVREQNMNNTAGPGRPMKASSPERVSSTAQLLSPYYGEEGCPFTGHRAFGEEVTAVCRYITSPREALKHQQRHRSNIGAPTSRTSSCSPSDRRNKK